MRKLSLSALGGIWLITSPLMWNVGPGQTALVIAVGILALTLSPLIPVWSAAGPLVGAAGLLLAAAGFVSPPGIGQFASNSVAATLLIVGAFAPGLKVYRVGGISLAEQARATAPIRTSVASHQTDAIAA